MTMIGRGGAVPEDGRPETAVAAKVTDETGVTDDIRILLQDNKITTPNWTLEFAPDDEPGEEVRACGCPVNSYHRDDCPAKDSEYVGDEPEKKEPGPFLDVTAASHQTDWMVEISVTCPDGRRLTSESWFPVGTMTPRTIGEYLMSVAENTRNRVNTLP